MSLYNGSQKIRDYDTTGVYIGTGKTNCITHIPEDIKLELNSNVLTLKAGSRVYIPNGFEDDGVTPRFDEVVIDNDVVVSCGNSGSRMAFLGRDGLGYDSNITYVSSGSTAPTNTGHRWYDTANNIIKEYINGSWQMSTSFGSLPFAILTADSNKVFTSIDQVFNGFGYMGSHMFVTPNVKVLIPNGWNDAQYNNIEVTQRNVQINRTNRGSATTNVNRLGLTYRNGNLYPFIVLNNNVFYQQSTKPSTTELYYTWYDTKENIIKFTGDKGSTFSTVGSGMDMINVVIGTAQYSSGRVVSFTPNTVKTTNDVKSIGFIYNGSELVYKGRHYESWSMPSSPSSKGYTLSGKPSSYVDRLFDKSSSTDRWGQGVSNSSKWFGIKFPFPVIIDSITVKQGFAGNHDDSRTYSVRFYSYSTTSGGTQTWITNQTNLNWAVDSSTNIPITSKPISRRLYCDCTMQEYGTLNEVYISGRRVL